MDFDEFTASLKNDHPPQGISTALKALWIESSGDWDGAHKIVQDQNDADSAWVHAYLHRKEGDISNASYWYERAGRKGTAIPHGDEWREIAIALTEGR